MASDQDKLMALGLVFEYLFDTEANIRKNRQDYWGPLSLWHHMRMQHWATMHHTITKDIGLFNSFWEQFPRSAQEKLFDTWGYQYSNNEGLN